MREAWRTEESACYSWQRMLRERVRLLVTWLLGERFALSFLAFVGYCLRSSSSFFCALYLSNLSISLSIYDCMYVCVHIAPSKKKLFTHSRIPKRPFLQQSRETLQGRSFVLHVWPASPRSRLLPKVFIHANK